MSPTSLTGSVFRFSSSVDIHYETTPGRGGRQLILLHGFGSSLETWRDVQDGLGQTNSLFLIDLKGHGLSSKPKDGRYTVEDQAEILEAFIRQQGFRNAVLVGHSFGGAVALMTCLRMLEDSADSIGALVLIGSAAYPQRYPFFVSMLRARLMNPRWLGLVPAKYRAAYTLNRIFVDRKKVTPERIDRYARFFDLPGCREAFIESARQLSSIDIDRFVAAIPRIAVPTLLIWGRNDDVVPLTVATRLKSELPDAKLEIVENCGHMPQEEKPGETVRLIHQFLGD